ncbi:MAG: SH3 domain-containing protein [Bryobacteraceae bacterium]
MRRSPISRIIPITAALALVAWLIVGCNVAPERAPVIGEAYAGPATLTLHRDIDPKSPTVATAHHGDLLQITARRRRWYKVRTAKGAEGWTDDTGLLDRDQMNRIRAMAKETGGLPSQGLATTFGTLHVHAEPNRQAVSFVQVTEGEKFDVIAHRVVTRAPLPRRELIVPPPKPERKTKKEKASRVPLPPEPAPPPPPRDWVELSKERSQVPEENLPPAATDDWTLIRTESGQSGWVLTSRIYMAIPDEVAQYAEGHRITSYFSLGKVRDGDVQKDIWLWTTAESLGEDHDFDGYRVFTWSLRHHRYETAYIQRREVGFFPVLAKTGAFSVCLETAPGQRVRKQYTMLGNAVRPAGQAPCENAPGIDADAGGAPNIVVNEMPAPNLGFLDRVKARLRRLFGK